MNRLRQATIQSRIERATATLETYLALSGTSTATAGTYEIRLADGQLGVERLSIPHARQLPLPVPGEGTDALPGTATVEEGAPDARSTHGL